MTNKEAYEFTDRIQREYRVSLNPNSPMVLNWFAHVRKALMKEIATEEASNDE